ncbi:MAG: sulfite exporter TauE/SafE family protein [Vicingaceae bacterium]
MNFQVELLAAFAIGFLGSLHCLGMCGPIALAVPSLGKGIQGRLFGGLIYNSGRIITYAALGLLVGTLGNGFVFFKWQQGISIFLGLAIIAYNLFPRLFHRFNWSWLDTPHQWVKGNLAKLLSNKSPSGLLGIGLLNGLLPCGLVYLGLAGSLESGNPWSGMLFMALFGLGTLPMMSGIHLFGNQLHGTWKLRISRLIPFLAIVIGLLFILRGMGLGIPYLSPSSKPHAGDKHCAIPSHRHLK